MVEGLLNKEESNASSRGEEVEEVAPHDDFFGFLSFFFYRSICIIDKGASSRRIQLIANRALPNLSLNFLQQLRKNKLIPRALHIKR